MTSDLAVRDPANLPAKIEYARFLAKSGLLPSEYREKPANVLFAYEYGELLGLHPIAAITGIHVIEGKPAIGASLISALVRRAGHRLRVQDNGTAARCQITRSDDPGFTYSATWDMERAKTAGLLGRTNWQRYPAAMRKARAISECARDACPEVLLGLHYTPDELGAEDDGGELIHDGWPAAANGAVNGSQLTEDEKDAAGLMTRQQRIEHAQLREMNQVDPADVEIDPDPDPDADPWATGEPQPVAAPESWQKNFTALVASLPIGDDDAVRDILSWLAGRRIAQITDMSRSEIRNARSIITDHVKRAEGDVEVAASALWEQYHAAKEAAGA